MSLEPNSTDIVLEEAADAPVVRRSPRRPRFDRDRPRLTGRSTGRGRQTEFRPARRIRREVGGIGLIVVGLIVLFASSAQTSAIIPHALGYLMASLVGTLGSSIFALGFMALGIALVAGHGGLRASRAMVGLGILLLVFLGLRQISAPGDGLLGRTLAKEPGGLLGLLIAEALKPLLGTTWGTVVLVACALCAVTLVSDVPLAILVQRVCRVCLLAMVAIGRWIGAHLHRRSERARLERTAARGARSRREAVVQAERPRRALRERRVLPGPDQVALVPVEESPATPPAEVEESDDPEVESAADEVITAVRNGDFSQYELPPVDLLSQTTRPDRSGEQEDTVNKMEILEQTLASFGIDAKVVEIERGPRVTRYEIRLPRGVRVSRITNLADDIALSLAALDVRVEAPVPGKGVIGIEVPNSEAVFVDLLEILQADEAQRVKSKIGFALGKEITGNKRMADLARMPHLLIAGATNSGKSVCLNTIIATLLCRARPDEVKLLLIDPKRVELTLFDGIPHLVAPVAHDVKQAAGLLRWAIREMEHRYEIFAELGVRNISGYNERAAMDDELEPMYYLVIIIDELADLMMQAKGEFEASICRLAQLARATGIHLVVATQRPSVNVITGTIKANIASRIAFAVASQADSRVILDINGAERLVGSGDMLYLPIDASKPMRIQGAYVAEKDIGKIVKFLKQQAEPQYSAEALEAKESGAIADAQEEAGDELFEKALEYVISTKYASASMLQRRMRIGYTRAARLIDMMEERGYIGPADGSRPREVYVTPNATGGSTAVSSLD